MFKKTRILILAAVTMVVMLLGSIGVFAADEVVPVEKTLNVASGLTTSQEFEFKLTLVNKDASTTPTGHSVAPTTVSDITTTITVETDGNGTVTQAGGFAASAFSGLDKPGEYLFTVTETTETSLTDGYGLTANTGENTYYLQVLVDKDGNKQYSMANDDWDPATGTDDESKVDKAAFTNQYTEVTTGGGDKPDNLTVKKVVSNPTYADPDEEFTITVKFTRDSGGINPETAAIAYDGTDYNYGETITLTLKAGESATITNIPVGSTYVVSETAPTNYKTPSISYGTNGQTIKNTGTNEATVTNTYNDISPTGIITHYLPYIAIILLAIGAFAFFVVSRRRRAVRY